MFIVHVGWDFRLEPIRGDQQFADMLKKFKQGVAENVEAEERLAEGSPVAEILHLANAVGADLIVMGTHGWTGLSRMLMGSTAEGVIRRARCPVLTVRAPFPVTAAEDRVSIIEEAAGV